MNILYVLNSGQPGGMEYHVLDLAQGMVNKKHKVHVWCPNGPIISWFENAGAKVTIAKIFLDIDPLYIAKLFFFLKKEKIDVVHSHELKAVTNALVAGKLAKTKVNISHTHTPISEWKASELKKKPTIFGYKTLINAFADREIALTESRKSVKMEEGILPSKLEVIPNAIDTATFTRTPEQRSRDKSDIVAKYKSHPKKFTFGTVGRLTPEKNHTTLLQAYKEFLKKDKTYKSLTQLVFAGGGPLEDQIQNQIHDLHIEENVVVTGRFSSADKVKFYMSFDAFVFPSAAEGFGLVLIEALAVGLPVICSDLEVLREVAGDSVYAYFNTQDHSQLANLMAELFKKFQDSADKEFFKALSQKAQAKAQEYNLETFVQNYEDLYMSFAKPHFINK